MSYTYTIYRYKYKVSRGFSIYFFARTDDIAKEMKELYEQGMKLKITFVKKTKVYIVQPPYEMEQEQIETLKRGNKK